MITHEEARALVNWKKGSKLFDYITQQENVMELYSIIENELEDSKHNYDAVSEMYKNSVAYASKIQAELEALKKDVVRYFELFFKKNITIEEINEEVQLIRILSKVGKE